MPRFYIHHLTTYKYEQPATYSANQIMLYPLPEGQEVLRHEVAISQHPAVALYTDYFGNKVGTFTLIEPHTELSISSVLEVQTSRREIPEHIQTDWHALEQVSHILPFSDFLALEKSRALPEMLALAEAEKNRHSSPFQVAQILNAYVYEQFSYQKGITNVETPLDEVWTLKAGVCQDFTHVLLMLLRLSGIPARYVSGYICPNKTGMRGEGATHAWVEIYLHGFGWLGLDPTNNCIANETHVRLATGRHFNDCSPVRGTYRGTANHELDVMVSVSYEDGHEVSHTEHTDYHPSEIKKFYAKKQAEQSQQ